VSAPFYDTSPSFERDHSRPRPARGRAFKSEDVRFHVSIVRVIVFAIGVDHEGVSREKSTSATGIRPDPQFRFTPQLGPRFLNGAILNVAATRLKPDEDKNRERTHRNLGAMELRTVVAHLVAPSLQRISRQGALIEKIVVKEQSRVVPAKFPTRIGADPFSFCRD